MDSIESLTSVQGIQENQHNGFQFDEGLEANSDPCRGKCPFKGCDYDNCRGLTKCGSY